MQISSSSGLRRARLVSLLGAVPALAWAAACGGGSSGAAAGPATRPGGADSGVPGAGGASSDGAGGTGNGEGGGIFTGGGLVGGTLDGGDRLPDGGFQQCAGTESGVEAIQLDMYVIQDHTASMGQNGTGANVNTGPGAPDCPIDLSQPPQVADKWCFATNALASYFTSQASKGNRAALQFMTSENDVCTGGPDNSEATPVVPLTLLPVQVTDPLVAALEADTPAGGLGTHIESALHGIADFTADNVTPGRVMIGVLITDGDPNGCSGDIPTLAKILSDHLTATGIKTYIIGMTGATPANLEQLAVAGGGFEHGPDFCAGEPTCHYWSVGGGDGSAIAEALKQIQLSTVIPCEYKLPPPPENKQFDPALVNLVYSTSATESTQITGVASENACDATTGGWYYDDPAAPKTIRLCKATCDTVTGAGAGAKLDVSYGCKTNAPRPPR
ncbi:MAG TPA: vWA domain-containing protein [Polyangiaceae bacterium]|nr:vWA domain-containing protein [Polyangiaceae bacterium]